MPEIMITIIFFIVLFWLIRIYNRFILLKNQVDAAWSDIFVQLKRRHDLIPKLVEVVKQYASYEQTLLSHITALRTEAEKQLGLPVSEINKTGKIEQDIARQLGQFTFLAEDYPDLQASKHYIALQKELSNIEETLQHSRRFYNGAVRLLNTRIDTIPDLIIARLFHYQYRQYFQMEMKP